LGLGRFGGGAAIGFGAGSGTGSATAVAVAADTVRAPPPRVVSRSANTTPPNAAAITITIAHASRCRTAAIAATPIRSPAWSRKRGRLGVSTDLL
jgi:hypothetical protein